jgi:TnpA family transposase
MPPHAALPRITSDCPTSKNQRPPAEGFLEVGKALKTIHNCKFLTDSSYRHRIHTVLCLHLLQNALVLVNTVMLERILYDNDYIHQMNAVDMNAMTPLFTSNVNPYGDINLDINKPSFLEVH